MLNRIQRHLQDLRKMGWTLPAIADKLDKSLSTIEKWKSGKNKPRNLEATYNAIKKLKNRKRLPKKKRYKKPRYL